MSQIKNFAETNDDFSNLTANAVYSHSQSNQSNNNEKKLKNTSSLFSRMSFIIKYNML